jgi:hypothetical protein
MILVVAKLIVVGMDGKIGVIVTKPLVNEPEQSI